MHHGRGWIFCGRGWVHHGRGWMLQRLGKVLTNMGIRGTERIIREDLGIGLTADHLAVVGKP